MAVEYTQKFELFYSYAHEDQDLRDKLGKHLRQLERQGLIASWHDRKILAGSEWAGEIDEHINTAQIILLLISSDFIDSDYCNDIEVKRAMERHKAREARVIPIILRPCDWHHAPFGKLQALPRDGKAITSWHNTDEVLYEVAKGIRAVIVDLQSPQSKLNTPSNASNKASNDKAVLANLKLNKSFNAYKVRDEWTAYILSNLEEAVKRERTLEYYVDNGQNIQRFHIMFNGTTVCSLGIHKGFMGREDDAVSFTFSERRATDPNSYHAVGKFHWNRQKEDVVLELTNFSLLNPPATTKTYTKEEFLQALWERVSAVIERSVNK